MEKIPYDYHLDDKGPWGISLQSWLDPERLALMVIDMQNYMTDARYSGRWSASGSDDYYYSRFEDTVLANIQKLMAACRKKGIQIVFLRIASCQKDLSDVPGLTRKRLSEDLFDAKGRPYHLHEEEEASQIDPRIPLEKGDILLSKTSSGAFNCSPVDSVLQEKGIQSLLFTGGLAEGCVSSTLRGAFDRGYLCTLVEDACISSKKEHHEIEVSIIRDYFAWVVSTDELLSLL